ncbi:hypothetical protein CEXT_321641 [Caerostris extrusa]|uniref:Uncharacterized protein n=1 Tax=Caerostris extrusa TaxID=172846 RepID=A0AAV4XZ86_CAEEX|nr:hypothetical protein CEXT_321641 [Caerostris extrusa]
MQLTTTAADQYRKTESAANGKEIIINWESKRHCEQSEAYFKQRDHLWRISKTGRLKHGHHKIETETVYLRTYKHTKTTSRNGPFHVKTNRRNQSQLPDYGNMK